MRDDICLEEAGSGVENSCCCVEIEEAEHREAAGEAGEKWSCLCNRMNDPPDLNRGDWLSGGNYPNVVFLLG